MADYDKYFDYVNDFFQPDILEQFQERSVDMDKKEFEKERQRFFEQVWDENKEKFETGSTKQNDARKNNLTKMVSSLDKQYQFKIGSKKIDASSFAYNRRDLGGKIVKEDKRLTKIGQIIRYAADPSALKKDTAKIMKIENPNYRDKELEKINKIAGSAATLNLSIRHLPSDEKFQNQIERDLLLLERKGNTKALNQYRNLLLDMEKLSPSSTARLVGSNTELKHYLERVNRALGRQQYIERKVFKPYAFDRNNLPDTVSGLSKEMQSELEANSRRTSQMVDNIRRIGPTKSEQRELKQLAKRNLQIQQNMTQLGSYPVLFDAAKNLVERRNPQLELDAIETEAKHIVSERVLGLETVQSQVESRFAFVKGKKPSELNSEDITELKNLSQSAWSRKFAGTMSGYPILKEETHTYQRRGPGRTLVTETYTTPRVERYLPHISVKEFKRYKETS